jgi:hypothetical protein
VATEECYDALYRRLTAQPEVEAPAVGAVRQRPARTRREPGRAQPRVAIAKLPVTGETFVAREEELARLDAAWESGTNVISFVAMGGAGKSALVNRWLDGMKGDNWRGAERVLGWSFYSQGTEAAGASSEAFTEYALGWLGYRGEVITSPWRKGEVLADLVRQARTLLVLDGLEPLQHPTGAQTGRIKDPAVQALARELSEASKLDPLPDEFSSYEEAADFWSEHDTADYPDAFEPEEDDHTAGRGSAPSTSNCSRGKR